MRTEDIREQLLAAGVGEYNAILSLPYMYFLPRTCDPHAQGIIQIVEGLQNLLNQRGAHLKVDGSLGPKTAKALTVWAGPRWYDKAWSQLYADVLAGKKWSGFYRYGRAGGYEQPLGTTLFGDVLASPLALVGIGAFVWWNWFRK